MKLHLPKSLRGALMACFASVASLTTTVATGTFAGGAFYVSLASMAQAEDVAVTSSTTWSNADAATHADDSVTVGDADAEDAITLQVGNGGTNALTAGSSIDFGTVTVNSGDTLKLHAWITTTKTPGSDGKVSIQSAFTLNSGSELWIEDGSYYFAEAITISGETSIRSKWGKGITLAALTGDENAVLTLSHGLSTDTKQYDDSRAVFELSGANESFEGTVKLDDDNGENQNSGVENGVQLILSNANALVNAILDFGETEDVVLSLNATKVLLKAIKGHGFVEYYNSTSTVGEIELSAAEGTFSGSSAANVNWTIAGGTQGLSNASILGTYTVGESAASTFEGAITLGSLVNNSTTGIDVSAMTSLTLNSQTAYQGATISGLGLLTGMDGNTFSYGDGWLATYDSATGTATLSDNSAIYWIDAGGADDTDNDWASGANWQGGAAPSSADTVRLGADAANKTIAFSADASIGVARVVEGDYVFTTDGTVTLTGSVMVSPVGASLSKAGTGTLTLTNVTANTLGSTAGTLTVNSLNLSSGDTFTKTGEGLMTLPDASTLLGKNITVEAGELHITQTGNALVTSGSNTTVTVKSGATLDDDRRLNVTGGSFTVTGGGVYELEGISLSASGKNATTLNVGADTVLRITGTTQSPDGQLGSFMLSHWAANNVVNIDGILVSDVGISDRDGSGTIYVKNGGVLQLNDGMSRTTHGAQDTTINVEGGASLVVNGNVTSGTDYITTNLAENATVFTTSGATILNAMNYNGVVKLGAAADTILSLTATTPNVGTITILGTGDTVKTFANDAVSNTAAGGTVQYTNAVSGAAITLNTGAKFEATAGLNLSGALTLAADSEATLGGDVELGSLANSGSIDVTDLCSLRLGSDAGSLGAIVNLGTVTYTAGNTFTYGNGWTATWQENGTALITADAAIAWADAATGGTSTDGDINWTTADNWSGSAAPTASDYVQLAATEGVSRTLALTADTTVAGLRVYDAYNLSVAADATYSFAVSNGITFSGDTASLSKTGAGTLAMTTAQAIAAKMNVTEGTLKLTDTLASAPLNTVTAQDLSAISATSTGVLAVTAGGAADTPGANSNNNYRGPTVSAISLANTFVGTVEVLGGKLSVTKSNLGAASLIHLNGGGLLVSSSGTAFAAQELGYNLHIGTNGGYLDHYGGSTSKEDSWSSKHTGTMTGSGTLYLTGYGEWMFAGTYTDFTGSIQFGNQAQCVYISSDMTGLTALVNSAAEVAVGYKSANNSAVAVAVSGKETLSAGRTIYFANASTFTHTAGVSVADGQTFSVQRYVSGHTGTYKAANVELGSDSTLSVGSGMTANITGTSAYTATAGTISVESGATVNDSRALTIDGAYTISGAGAYNQLGSLALTADGALTLSGDVSITSLAGNNAGTITFADTLTSLQLGDFELGADYEIGTVTDGENVEWASLLGITDSNYRLSYADGILSSVNLGAIKWASPVDDDITWDGVNWMSAGGEMISITATNDVVLDVIDTTAETPVSSTIKLAANTEVAGLIVNDAYNLSIDSGATYSFAAGSYAFGANGSLSKTGAGTLSMSLAQAQSAKMHITEGALKLTDAFSHTLTQSVSGRVHYDLSGITAGVDGVLQVDLNGSWSASGMDATALVLDADFFGTLEVVEGQLLIKYGDAATDGKSDFGGASAIRLNQGALFFNANSSLEVGSLEIASGNGYITNRSGLSTISSALSGTGNLIVQANGAAKTIKLTGAVDLDGKLTNSSGTLTLESTTKALFDGGVLLSGGTININSAADISELSVTGGAFNINGAEVGVTTLKTGSSLTLTGTAHLTAGLEDTASVTLTGAATASATLTVAENGTANLQAGLVLDTLTVNAGGTLALNGDVSVGSLSNAGSIDVAGISSLAIADFNVVSGATYNVGTLIGYESADWNAMLGVNDTLSVSYDAGTGYLSIATNMDNPVLWMGAEGATWDSTAADGSDTASWMRGDAAYSITADSAVVLGNADTLGDSSDAVSCTIVVDADTVVNSVTVQDAYSLSVAADSSYSFDVSNITLEQGGSLSKTGEGTLSMSVEDAVAAQIAINAGVLQISGTLAGTSADEAVELSAINGSGTLAITPAGVNGDTSDGTRTAVELGDAFTGTLRVSGGQLDAGSDMGGATLMLLDAATLTASSNSVSEVAWNIQVSDNDAYLRHFGNTGADERTSYATRLTGALSGGAGAMLTVIDSGEWFFAGDMSNYAGGLSVNGDANYVTFEQDATLASLTATAGSRVFVTNNATLNATSTATSGTGTVYAGAVSGASLNLGAVTIANGTTLDITGGGTHTADSVNMSAAATGLTLGASTTLTVTGALNGDTNGDTETLTITLGENAHLSLGSTAHTQTIGTTLNIVLGTNSVLTDAAVRRLGNSHLSITGTGVYELKALQLSNGASADTSVTIGAGATLHITGTALTATGDGGSLLTGTQNNDNVITVNGTLALECGVSRYNIDTTANTINVNSGGKIAFNQGLTAANKESETSADIVKDILNIKDGGVLEVSTTTTTDTNKLAVNIENNAIIMGGKAGDTTESMIENNLVFGGGAYVGAKAGTTLTIAPADGETSLNWLDIIGTADTQGVAQEAGGKVVFAFAVTSTWNVNVLAGAEADFQDKLTINGASLDYRQGLHNAGTLTLNGAEIAGMFTNAANSTATFKGAISIGSLENNNAGTIDVADATSLTLGDFSLTDGSTYTIGALTGLSETHTIGSLLGAGAYHDVTYDGTSTVSVVSHLVWDAQNATDGDNVWNTAADNLNWKVDTDTEKAFDANKVIVFAPNTDAVNSTVVVGEDVAAGEIRLLGSYTFQADADRTLGGAVKLMADDAALTKTGSGTLTLTDTVELNTASTLTVNEGEMKLQGGVALANGIERFTKDGAGTLTLVFAAGDTTLQYVDLTVNGGILNIDQSGECLNPYNDTHTVASGAIVNDSRRLGSSGSLTFTGGGVYNVAGIALSRENYAEPCTLTVESGTTLHITGTDVAGEAGAATDGTAGAFMVGNYAANNTVNVHGTLISDAGISNINSTPTINVENGGTLQLNAGLSGSNYNLNESTDVTLNVNSGGVLIVNSSNTTNTNRINVQLGQATVFTTEGGTILNDMSYNSTVSLGAAADKTLSLTETGQVDMFKLTILGTADTVKGTAAGGEVAFSSKVSGMSITLKEGAKFSANGGLNLIGTLTLNTNALATLNGEVSVYSLDNAGTLDVSGVTSLNIASIDYSVGESYHVGAFTGKTTEEFLALIGTGGDRSLTASYDAATGMISFDSSIYWLDGTEADNSNSLWSSAENWSTGSADDFTLAGVTVKLGAEATNRNVVLDSDVDANTTVHVAEAYTMTVQEGESHALNGRLEYAENENAGLTKSGDGTLTMSLENATLGKGVHIAAGTLEVLGNQTTNSNDGKLVVGGFAANGPHDLSAISADAAGTLSVALYGNVNNNTFDTSALTLADDFLGTVEVTHGYLLMHYNNTIKSTLGGTSKIRLDGGGVALYENDTLATAIEVGSAGGWLMGRKAGNEYSGAITGAGILTLVSNWGGDDVLTLSGSVTLTDYEVTDDAGTTTTAHSNLVKKGGSVVYITGADNNINITGGVVSNAGQLVFQNKQTLNSLAINGGTVSLEKDATLGAMSMQAATLTIGTAATDSAEGAAATVTITSTAARADQNNKNRTVTLYSDSVVNDSAQWQLTGGTLTLNGEGEYNLAGMQLSANQANATTLNIESGTTLHITGETDHATQNNGSFVLAHWNSANTVNVAGKLALECGISTHSGYTSQSNINVADGATIAFNQGLTAAGKDNAAIINIAGGGTLEVSGTDTTGTNLVTVNVADGSFIMGGNANSSTESVIANNLVFDNGAYIGAKTGTTLTIEPEAGSTRLNWLDIIGTDNGAGGRVVFASDLSVGAALLVHAGSEAEMQGSLTLTNVYSVTNAGKLTLRDDVDAPTIGNSGELIFDGTDHLVLDSSITNRGTVRFENVGDMFITLDALEVSGSFGGALRKWQIVSNEEGGSLVGWQKQETDATGNVTLAGLTLNNFILDGETLSLDGDEWDGYELGADGTLTIYQSYRYWDSVAGENNAVWDTTETVWRDRTTMEDLVYEANSRVAFGEYEDADDINGAPAELKPLNKNVTVVDAGVLAKNLDVFGTNYVFEGGKITVTKALSIQQSATFNNTLVIGDAATPLNITVESGMTMTLNTLETLSTVKNGALQYNAEGGSFRKTGEGILSITGAVTGIINSAAVEEGTLQLADTVNLTVGANRITGGSLQNVVLSGAGTSISAFAEDSNAVLTDVVLNAGSSTAYATVQDVSFAGASTLSGYITFEQSQSTQDMQVAAGGTLTISNLTLDLCGLAAGEKQIILNAATTDGLGAIVGWDSVNLVYSGVAVNAGSVDMTTDGVIKIAETGAALYWDGMAAGSATATWDTTSTNWSATEGTDGSSIFYALSDTYFGATPEGAAKDISLNQDVVMTNLFFTAGGYTINGSYNLATLGDVSFTHAAGDVNLNTALVVQGSINSSGAGYVSFGADTTAVGDISLANAAVTVDANLTTQGDINVTSKELTVNSGAVSAAGDISIVSGSSASGDAGSFTLGSGASLSATNITIDVEGGAASDAQYGDVYVDAAGSITATDTLTVTGTATKQFTGTVTADKILVDQADHAVSFAMLSTNELTITNGSTANLLKVEASVGSIKLGGTLGFEKFAGTYGGYNIVSTSADAKVTFATITSVTLAAVTGQVLTQDAEGNPLTYGSIAFGSNYRNLTINSLSNIQNITIGAGEYGATLNNATGGVHGNLTLEGGKLTVNSANIMANGTGQWLISGNLVLGHTTQTLAGNTINLTNGLIGGNTTHNETQQVVSTNEQGETITTTVVVPVRNEGLVLSQSSTVNYGGENTISANLTLADATTLTLQAAHATGRDTSGDSLLLSGSLSGSAGMLLQGAGVVTLSGANADYTGTVTVGTESTLELTNTAALSAANISVQESGMLQLNAGGTVNVADLSLADGAALSFMGLAGTDAPSLDAAALLHADAADGISWVPNAQGNLTLSILFDAELENMKTYNLFNDVQSLAASGVSLSVMHNGVALDASQYKVGYDENTKLVYIRTMLGNIWSGGALLDGEDFTGDGIWAQAANNADANWTGNDYAEGKAAIFVDLSAEHDNQIVTVTLADEVAPQDVYFEANKTYYELVTAAGDTTSGLATGTNIHKAGSAYVYLGLANNSTMENALGSIDLQAGRIVLYNDLAVQGDVFIGKTAELRAYGASLVKEAYTAKGQFSNLTMTDDAIRGASADNRGTVTSTYANGQEVYISATDGGAVLLENLYLATNANRNTYDDALHSVTIGENVEVTGNYTLSGAMVFNNTLANSGIVTLAADMTAEIGKLGYAFSIDENGASWYTYQLVQGGTINGMSDLLVTDVTIGGVSLGSGLADGVATYISSADGSITLSIGNITATDDAGNVTAVDGTIGVPQWDARWSATADAQPALSRRFGGTDAAANVTFGEGMADDTDYYWYSSVVNETNADKVNSTGNEVAVTLSAASTGNRAAGGSSAASSGLEMWIYDRSGFDTVIGGQYTDALNHAWKQTAKTHVLVNSAYDGADDDTAADQKTWVVGGSWNTAQTADSHLTIQDGNILTVVGGTYGANQDADSYVYLDGGTVWETFAGGYDATENTTYYGNVENTYLTITGGTLGYHVGVGTTDEVRKRVYGGSYYGNVSANVNVTVDGDAVITDLVGGGYHGTVGGGITMDLVNGTVTGCVDAAGIGGSTVTGNVLVNLYQDFNLAEIYGGKQHNSGATVTGTSTLHFAEAGVAYDLTQEKIQGFSHFTLADGTTVKVSTDSGTLTDASGVLTIGGAGLVELVGGADMGRNITLVDGSTLWFNSGDAGNYFSTDASRNTITATAGTTLEITGQPGNGQGLCFWVDLAGHGVDGKGAMYKGLVGAATTPSGKVALPRITLSDSASIGAADNIYVIEHHNEESELFLNGNTLTKLGENSLMLYNTTVKDNTNANAVVDGTIYVKEGILGTGYGMNAAKTNVVLGAETLLDVTNTGTQDVVVGAISGSGDVSLGNNLTLTTAANGNYGTGSDWMTQGADTYGQFSKDTGFAYGVYSGRITGSTMLNIAGDGTQYLSGSDSTFTGGVHLKESATLYLLGGTTGAATAPGASAATSGVVGTGAIAWDSADATLYLGDGVRVFNNGTTNVSGSNMIIGVEAAPKGDALTNYQGKHTSVMLNGVEYVEIATHNLYSISCNGLYADGTAYTAGSAIDRDKMLLVTKADWDAGTATVQGFSAGGYNEAIYSGVLSGQANLVKVGQGTLVLDQKNSYTGSTTISEGTLALKGWAQIGGSSSSAALNVVQTAGSTLMLAYDGTYAGEITGITNNISLSGTGDARWTTESRTGNATAALISDVGGNVTFTLSGNISGDGNLLHSGEGTLVLSGYSTYTGGTHATSGVVEVQSATGLGAGAVKFEADSDLHVTVEAGTTASRLTTTMAQAGSYVKGKVHITGTDTTERVLSVNTDGFAATNTTVEPNGTLLVNGAGVQAATGTLSGKGKLAVSDATAAGAKASVGALTDFSGDIVVEGNKAAVEVASGNYSGGSISISGENAKLDTAGNVNIAYGEKLELKSTGSATSGDDNAAATLKAASLNISSGGTLSVSAAATNYRYNLAGLQQAASAAVNEMLNSGAAGTNLAMGANATTTDYTYHFDSSRALNAQTAGMVEGGLTLNSASRYEERSANISLAGGALTLNTTDGKIALDLFTNGNVQTYDDGYTSQIVLFSGVSSLTLDGTPYGEANAIMMMAAADGESAAAANTVYSTLASNYFTGWNITDDTQLVYDVGAGVVYLDKAVPEPTTTTLSLLALAALIARRRRK